MLQLISFPPGMPSHPLATWAVGKNVPEPSAIDALGEPASEEQVLAEAAPVEPTKPAEEKPAAKARRRRAHDPDGQFRADDPVTTGVNEAWEEGNPEA